MKKFSSFAVFEMLLDEANERFAPLFQVVPERLEILKEYCGVIDDLIVENGGKEFKCSIDEVEMTIKMSVSLEDIQSSIQDHRFNDLIKRAWFVKVTNEAGEYIKITFVFPRLWEKA